MMQSIFGSSSSAHNVESVVPNSDSSTPEVKSLLREYAKNVLKTTTVVETKKFAGQNITYVYIF